MRLLIFVGIGLAVCVAAAEDATTVSTTLQGNINTIAVATPASTTENVIVQKQPNVQVIQQHANPGRQKRQQPDTTTAIIATTVNTNQTTIDVSPADETAVREGEDPENPFGIVASGGDPASNGEPKTVLIQKTPLIQKPEDLEVVPAGSSLPSGAAIVHVPLIPTDVLNASLVGRLRKRNVPPTDANPQKGDAKDSPLDRIRDTLDWRGKDWGNHTETPLARAIRDIPIDPRMVGPQTPSNTTADPHFGHQGPHDDHNHAGHNHTVLASDIDA